MTNLFESKYLKVGVNASDEVFITHKLSDSTLRIGDYLGGSIRVTWDNKTIIIPTSVNGLSAILFQKFK